MTTRRVMRVMSQREHLSVRGDLAPLCSARNDEGWAWYAVSGLRTASLCGNCRRVVDRLSALASGGQPNG